MPHIYPMIFKNYYYNYLCVLLFGFCLSPVLAGSKAQTEVLRVSVAMAAMETGLMQALASNFEQLNPGVKVKFESVGAIQALDNAREGLADITLTHYTPAEKRLVTQGFGLHRANIMYNEYAIFGPAQQLESLSEANDIIDILRILAEQEVAFLEPSPRGGTYRKIRELWVSAGINPNW